MPRQFPKVTLPLILFSDFPEHYQRYSRSLILQFDIYFAGIHQVFCQPQVIDLFPYLVSHIQIVTTCLLNNSNVDGIISQITCYHDKGTNIGDKLKTVGMRTRNENAFIKEVWPPNLKV